MKVKILSQVFLPYHVPVPFRTITYSVSFFHKLSWWRVSLRKLRFFEKVAEQNMHVAVSRPFSTNTWSTGIMLNPPTTINKMTLLEYESNIASYNCGGVATCIYWITPAVNTLTGGKCFVGVWFKAAKTKILMQVPHIPAIFYMRDGSHLVM